ncbi:pickpocket protein 11-like [Arctopsyche grandis]|uniref:pickpocket protein 11-like n=1 Tax=Arctopsyche grandis TaxID=121162 RepID=UPI00406D8C35
MGLIPDPMLLARLRLYVLQVNRFLLEYANLSDFIVEMVLTKLVNNASSNVSPTVISLERDHLSWNTTFPAATICFKDLNETALEEVIAEYNATDKDSLRIFLLQLVKISVVDVTDAELEDNPLVPPEKFLEIMDRIQINFIPQILTSLNLPIRVQKTIVEMGLCYSINSKIAMYNSIEYRFGNKDEIVELPNYDAHQLDGELFIQLSDFSEAYTIYFHSPTEIPQSLDKSLAGAPLSFRSVILKVINLYSTDEVRELYLSQRKCRYMEENILSRSPVYSYSMCTVECRARKTLEICGCMPHYYKALPNERICLLSELRCLYTYRSALSSVSKKGGCDCLPTCDTNYFTIYEDTVLQWDRWTQVKYGIREYPKIRLKREVLYGIKEVLVNCGGAAGLLLGCSFLTIIEVVYFVTLRLFWFIMGRRQDAEL